MSKFKYEKLFQFGKDNTKYIKLDSKPFKIKKIDDKEILVITKDVIENLTKEALNTFVDLCLNKDVKNHSDGALALKTVRILEAMYKSIESKELQQI